MISEKLRLIDKAKRMSVRPGCDRRDQEMKYSNGRRGRWRILSCLLVLLCSLCLLCSGVPVAAQESGQNSIRLHSDTEGAQFTLYQVAQKNDDGTFSLTKDFASAGVEVNDLSTDGLEALGTTLSAYIGKNQPSPAAAAQTVTDGVCQWSDLSDGLYLVLGTPKAENGNLLEFSPVVAYLPYTVDGQEQRSLDTEEKAPAEVPQTTQYSVYKVWKDGTGSGRPASVKVALVRRNSAESSVVDTQTLSADNNWSYTCKDLPQGYVYQAVETGVPNGYTQAVSRDGAKIVITNTKKSTSVTSTVSGKLPQTGQLWWSVPVLVLAGLACLLAAVWTKSRGGRENTRKQ